MTDLSARDARRIALSATGLATPRPARRGAGALAAMTARLGMVQMDSVNVLTRAHYMPGFSRLGAYDPALLDRAASGPKRSLFEYWGHEAALIRVELQPALRWRMARARDGRGIYGGLARFGAERRPFIEAALKEVEARGPLAARDLTLGQKGAGGWWGWSEDKRAMEWLFWAGFVTTHSRRGFERIYDLTERVLPDVCSLPTPAEDEAQRQLVLAAASALGVATAADLRNYWRLPTADIAPRVRELVEAGALVKVAVEGWRQEAYMPADLATRLPRPKARALVSPFDPLLWERDRAERLFGFRYRIEIYTPAEQREHGYYVLPFLMGEAMAARLDLKADRATGRLMVKAAHAEPGADPQAAADALAGELALMAQWLRLDTVVVEDKGDLAPALRDACHRRGEPSDQTTLMTSG
jgi:uncharacterized protein YcaQ